MEPFDVLLDQTGLPAVELPAGLARVLGGDLGFAEESVYANFVATLDGAVAIPSVPQSNELIAGDNDADRFLMGVLRALADAVLIGAGVLHESPKGTWRAEKVYPPAADAYAELRAGLQLPPKPEVAILTGSGSIDPHAPVLEGRAVVLTSEAGAERLDGELPAGAELVALGSSPRLDGTTIVGALRERGHRRILCEAGPHTFGALLAAEVVDEVFLTTSPLLVGDAGPGSRFHLVETADLLPPVGARLTSLRRHGDHLFSRYALTRRRGI